MWKPLSFSVERCQLIATVCARLHNLCTDRRLTRQLHAALGDGLDGLLLGGDEYVLGNATGMAAEALPTLAEILARSENDNIAEMAKLGEKLPKAAQSAVRDELRDGLRDYMAQNGLFYDR